MPIIVTCPQCSTKLGAPDTAAGKKVRCPKCQTVCDVPTAAAAVPAAPKPAPLPPPPAPQFEVLDEPAPPKPRPAAAPPKPGTGSAPKIAAKVPGAKPPVAKAAAAKPLPLDDEDDSPAKKPTRKPARRDDDEPHGRPRTTGSKRAGMIAGGIGAAFYLIMIGGGAYAYTQAQKLAEDLKNLKLDEVKKANDPDTQFDRLLDAIKKPGADGNAYFNVGSQPIREDRRKAVAGLLERGLQDRATAAQAAYGLSRWGTRDNVPALVRALEMAPRDADGKNTRRNVITALGQIGDPSAVTPLVTHFRTVEADRAEAGAALRKFGTAAESEVRELLDDPDPKVRDAARSLLREMGATVPDEPVAKNPEPKKIEPKKPDPKQPTTPTTPMPGEWTTYKGGGFEAFMPAGVSKTAGRLPTNIKESVASATRHFGTDANITYTVFVVRFSADSTDAGREKAFNALLAAPFVVRPGKVKQDKRDKVKWAGWDAVEITYTPDEYCVVRTARNDTVGYIAIAQADARKLDPDRVKGFFESVTLDKE